MLVKMMKILIIFYVSCFIVSQVQGNCHLEGVTESDWQILYTNDPRNDNVKVFKTFTANNITNITLYESSYAKYVNVELKENTLEITATDAFENFEKNEASVSTFTMNVDIFCYCSNSNTKTLRFYQPIKDLNTFPPTFTEDLYTFKVPTPLPGDMNMACFGTIIEACDYDITNTRLDFSVDPPDDFILEWETSIDDKVKCHRAKLKTKKPFTHTENNNYDLVVTDIGIPVKTGISKLHIEVDQTASIPPNPYFNQAYYMATYNTDSNQHTIDVAEDITLEKGYDGIDLKVLEYDEYFKAIISSDKIEVNLMKNLPEELMINQFVPVTIQADLENAEKPGRTVLIVELPKQTCPEITTPGPTTACPTTIQPTECPICTPATTISYTCPPCTTVCPTTTTDCPSIPTKSPTTSGELSPTTEYPVTQCPTVITNCPPCSTTSVSCPTIPTEGSSPITECPVTECPSTSTNCPFCSTTFKPDTCPPPTVCPTTCASPESPTPEITTVCPPCVTTTEPPQTPLIKFERENYWLDAKYNYVGLIGYVRATAVPSELILYSLESLDGTEVPKAIEYKENTGAVMLNDALELGEYTFLAIAQGVSSNTKDETIVVINICTNCGELETEHTIEVHHVDENLENDIQLCNNEDCVYEVIDQYPKTIDPLFKFRNGNLHHGPLNRLNEEVKNMLNPQFVVTLHLVRSTADITRNLNNSYRTIYNRNSAYDDEGRELVYLPPNILNIPNQLLISIIIKDVNDNWPIFDEGNKLIVGYPVQDLAAQLAPPYVTKVKATDKDVGQNADIRYSTTSTYFTIHPKTGVIYPTQDAFKDNTDLTFVVKATDMDGHDSGKSSNLEIEIKLLEEEHLTVLTIKNLMLEDVEDKLKELSSSSNIQLRYLTAFVVPESSSSEQTASIFESITQLIKYQPVAVANADHLTRVVVYGFNEEEDPVTTEQLQEELEESGSLEDIEIDKWTPPSGDGSWNDCEESSVAGFIAAISVLASLLVIFIIAAVAFYYFKIYKTRKSEPYATMEEEDAGSINFEKTAKVDPINNEYDELPAKRRPTGFVFSPPLVEEEDEDEYGENKVKYEEPVDFYTNMNRQENNEIYNTPVDYSINTTNSQNLPKAHDENDYSLLKVESSPTEFRDKAKSVSFKPTVEKINIVVEDEKQDDILDERL